MFPVIVGRVRNARLRAGRAGAAGGGVGSPVDEAARAPHGPQPLELLERPLLRSVLAAPDALMRAFRPRQSGSLPAAIIARASATIASYGLTGRSGSPAGGCACMHSSV